MNYMHLTIASLFYTRPRENNRNSCHDEANEIKLVDQTKKLEFALSKKHFYQFLIHLVKKDSENLMRFLASLEDWECVKNKREKKQKGRKIVSIFFSPGGQFEITRTSNGNSKDITCSEFNEKSSALAKDFALKELLKDPVVMSALEFELLSQDDDIHWGLNKLNSCELTEDGTKTELSDAMIQLLKVIQCQCGKRELINHLNHLKTGQLDIKIRFIATVCQYEQCSVKQDQQKIAQKIIFIFIRPEAVFSILSLPEDLQKQILFGNEQCLLFAKNVILKELCSSDDVINFMRTFI